MISVSDCCRLDRRKRAIVEAARTLFVEQGFESTTLSEIVALSGGSLATIYKLFGNKESLLEAVVFDKAESGDTIVRDAASDGGSPAEVLHRVGGGLHAHFLKPDVVALVRIVISRSIQDREFAALFFERTASRTRMSLETLFVQWQRSGIAMRGAPGLLAEMFLGLFVSDVHAEAISHGIAADHSPERLRARIDFFIAGAGIGPSPSSSI
ncbi:TetR/AcrR family transcriptional regulator [Alteriqipengyuania sp. 357]